MKQKAKYYVVWVGVSPGIYTTWAEASKQVTGFAGARHKSFRSLQEAEAAFYKKPQPLGHESPIEPDLDDLVVDASCSGAPGPMEYRGVWLLDRQPAFQAGPYQDGTNNVGEFLAIVHAARMLKAEGRDDVKIYSDSQTALSWVTDKTCRTNLKETARNKPIFDLIASAEEWLRLNRIVSPILKWRTEHWGENPADFGRK